MPDDPQRRPGGAAPASPAVERTAPGCNLAVKRGAANWRYAPIGTVQIRRATPTRRRPHARIKVRDDGPEHERWRYLAVVVWERARGPVPAGLVLWHRNGDSLDCRIENLEAITPAERLRRNIANNAEVCRAAYARQAARIGRKYWRAALDARRLKAHLRKRKDRDHEAHDPEPEEETPRRTATPS